jgi:arylformamidase
MKSNYDNYIDISIPLSADTIIYPGDPKPEYSLFNALERGEIANVGMMKHGLHHGTHVDVPYHFMGEGTKKIDEIPLTRWIGPALVIDATGENECVNAETVKGIDLKGYDKVLFKTKNSTEYYKKGVFFPQFIYLDKGISTLLVQSGIKTVGLDYITVDPHGSVDFPAHKTLLGNDVCIIECINLENVNAGEYFLMCLPLKLVGTDGANARVILLKPGFTV